MDTLKRAVVFEPHNDDLIIGMGGTALQLLSDEWHITSIVLTDGRYGSTNLPPSTTAEVRREEKQAEVDHLGIDRVNLGIEDSTLWTAYEEDHNAVLEELKRHLPDAEELTVFVPAPSEGHPDHRATHAFVQDLQDSISTRLKVVLYLVWNVPFVPHELDRTGIIHKVDIDEQLREKKTCIKIHESQEEERPYTELAEKFNKYLAVLYHEAEGPEAVELLSVRNENPSLLSSISSTDVTSAFHSRFSH